MMVCGWESSGKNEGKNMTLKPVSSVMEVHTTYETITLFFCKYNICKHDEQNVLNVKFILSGLNCNISSKQLSITHSFGEKE